LNTLPFTQSLASHQVLEQIVFTLLKGMKIYLNYFRANLYLSIA
jgi:hypothetical protein